jgi:hypothetical protein
MTIRKKDLNTLSHFITRVFGCVSLTRTRVTVDERQESRMSTSPRLLGVFVVFAVTLTAGSASAITVELAKKCSALTAKAYPPRVIGNPAAGGAKGTGPEIRAYYNKCVANGGEVLDQKA